MKESVHLMGIGGAGMSVLAQLLLQHGYLVSGCDTVAAPLVSSLGIPVFLNHDPAHVRDVDTVVYSSAIPLDHPELLKAKKKWHRTEMLALLTQQKRGIAVTGSHGKTTTSAMISFLLCCAGLDPSVAIGAETFAKNAHKGEGEFFVFEADESDGSFRNFSPELFVITNLDNDHLDFYQTFPNLVKQFETFFKQQKQILFLNGDDPYLSQWKDLTPYTFGCGDGMFVQAKNCKEEGVQTRFDLVSQGNHLGTITLSLPGKHNLSNALAACAVGLYLKIPFPMLQQAFVDFRGPRRRFEIKGEEKEILVVDDYAHHPTEVRAVLQAARGLARSRLICVFQPHRYSRTRHLYAAFAEALALADEVILTDIYAASEKPIPGVTGELIYQSLKKGHYIADVETIPEFLLPRLQRGDLVMTVGAGDVWQTGEKLLKSLKTNKIYERI